MRIAIYLAALVAILIAMIAELTRDLMMYQQNSYRPDRYRRWLKESGDTTSTLRLVGMFLFLFSLAGFNYRFPASMLLAIFGIFASVNLLRRKYKKPLVWTHRVWRLFCVALALVVCVVAVGLLLFSRGDTTDLYVATESLLLCFCASHIIVLTADFLLQPVEKSINRKFYRRAEEKLRSMPSLKIIGITGSYGKTSTKYFLERILSERFQTLMTPGNFNTTLGVVRTIGEYLKPYHEVFIVEMGAKQKGDIKEICDLVHPSVGIVTAVGPQHLESFGSIDNVLSTKFELIDSLPSSGLAVVNNDYSLIAGRPVTNVECERYSVRPENQADVRFTARDIKYTPSGTTFKFVDLQTDTAIELSTRLVGECNISNLVAAVAVARELGVPDQSIRYAVEQIQPVEHRLSIKRIPGSYTLLDDAYNSNPAGSAMALDVLSAMTGGKRILVTPGMIELGDEQYKLNRDFGEKAAACCDFVIVVGMYNREAIEEGLVAGGMDPSVITRASSFSEAYNMLKSFAGQGDTILIENDLPDTFK